MARIISKTIVINSMHNNTNIKIPFVLEKDYVCLKINYEYSPEFVSEEKAVEIIKNAIPSYVPSDDKFFNEIDKYLPLWQLITPSLSKNGEYIGVHHSKLCKEQIIISKDCAYYGFLPCEISKGEWELQFNIHNVNEETTIKFEISAEEFVYYPVELHTHTIHSDGAYTPKELVSKAKEYGYKAMAITDHNTTAPLKEVENEDFTILDGIEWTTYFGHMLVLGAKKIVDWREATPDTIDEWIDKVKKEDGIVGLAHPSAYGSPMCTGCNWQFKVKNWNNVSYIEVYNGANPEKLYWNLQAYDTWIELLGRGHKLAITAGRDWHSDKKEDEHFATTYLGMKELSKNEIKNALKKGNTYISLSCVLNYSIYQNRDIYFGDEIKADTETRVKISLEESEISDHKELEIDLKEIILFNNTEIAAKANFKDGIDFKFLPKHGYIRIEVIGIINEIENKVLITSPVYVD